MREHRLAERWLAVTLLLVAVGCGDDPAPASTGGFEGSGSDDDDTSGGATAGAGGDPGLGPTATSSAGSSGAGGGGGSAAVTGSGGGAAGGGDGGGGGAKPFAAKCAADAECASATCHKFGKKGKRCTQVCMADADCPDDSAGCGEASVCKLPAGGDK
ncbi:MAG: hypothetical protein WKG00_00570 [Polyangiaceae bacterium]